MEQKPTETKQSRKLFVTLASPKVLSLGNTQINLVFLSLIRTFAFDLCIV